MSIYKITTNGFYLIENIYSTSIQIEKNIYAIILIKNFNKNLNLILEENSKLDIYLYSDLKISKKILINQFCNNSSLNFKGILFNNTKNLTTIINNDILGVNSRSFIEIISLIKNKKLNIDSTINIKSGSINIDAILNQKNIFLTNKGSIIGIPKLFIESNKIKASHSCKIEEINIDNLFYLKTKGLNEKQSKELLVNSYFTQTFKCLEMLDSKIYYDLKKLYCGNI